MKNKKTIALAMAAATVVPMAVPAFAAEKSLANTQAIDVRLANGYLASEGSVNIYTREQAFNTNGTEYTSDDTLKAYLGEDAKIIAIHKGELDSITDDLYVIAKKADKHLVEQAKAQIEQAKNEIEDLKSKGYTITTKNIRKMSFDGTRFEDSLVEVTAVKGNDDVILKYQFKGVENLKIEDEILTLKKLFDDVRDDLDYPEAPNMFANLDKKSGESDKDYKARYDVYNKLKYIIESNKDRFDFVIEENNGNKDLLVTLYLKGTKGNPGGIVENIIFENFAKVNKDLIINMPSKIDIDGHWAESDIKDAMLKGYVDASATFRPKDGITRAEFAKMLCTVLGIDTEKAAKDKKLEEPFHDVTSSDWHYKYIVALYNNYGTRMTADNGVIINGYEGDLFKPNAKITREEAAKMVAAAYEVYAEKSLGVGYTEVDKLNGFEKSDIDSNIYTRNGIVDITKRVNMQTIHRDIETDFIDDKDIASWADESVQSLKDNRILSGNPDGTFKPKSEINRAEALVTIQRLAKVKVNP